MDNSDILAVEKCQKGDLDQFAGLYEKYIEKIYKFIFYKTHHKETAEDLCAKTFLKALEKINDFDLSAGTFQAWLYKIARNNVIDHYRTDKSNISLDDVWDLSDDSDLVKELDNDLKLESVRKYLRGLKSEQRDILIMRIWQGLSYREISEITGKSEASLKMVFSRTINKFRTEMPATTFLLFCLLSNLSLRN
jgi:RNA polymerase sigma-70 factor (ECF subfamily)